MLKSRRAALQNLFQKGRKGLPRQKLSGESRAVGRRGGRPAQRRRRRRCHKADEGGGCVGVDLRIQRGVQLCYQLPNQIHLVDPLCRSWLHRVFGFLDDLKKKIQNRRCSKMVQKKGDNVSIVKYLKRLFRSSRQKHGNDFSEITLRRLLSTPLKHINLFTASSGLRGGSLFRKLKSLSSRASLWNTQSTTPDKSALKTSLALYG
mmetsp:Transcript_67686/g.180954  ORF Transcript_67686/g.180954 Transcript_67686/m.180954 type:complete len:205 (-) Transcript_67686:556-1170(-)